MMLVNVCLWSCRNCKDVLPVFQRSTWFGCSSLSDNQFTGDFPSSITTLTKLTLLYVQATFSLGESLGHAAKPHEPFYTLAIIGSESGFRHWLQGACGQQFRWRRAGADPDEHRKSHVPIDLRSFAGV
jgi:hypothetical protein